MLTPITNDKELDRALDRADELMNKRRLSKKQTNELKALSVLIEAYEDENHPMPKLDPIAAILSAMKEFDLRATDLVELGIFRRKERASEKLNYQYRLTLDEIRAAHEKLHIPLEVLVKDYPLKKTG